MNKIYYLCLLITIIIYCLLKIKSKTKIDNFEYSENLIKIPGIMNKLILIKGHEYMIKNKLQNNKFIFNNFINDKKADYFCRILDKYHFKETTDNPEIKPCIAFDHILADQLIKRNNNNKKIVKELTKAKKEFLKISNKILELCCKKFNKKLRLHSCNIICGFSGFSIPLHVDNNHTFIENNNNSKYIILPEQIKEYNYDNSYLRIPLFEKNNNNKEFDIEPNFNLMKDEYDSNDNINQNILFTNNFNNFSFKKTKGKYKKFSGGGNDQDATVSAILYLSSKNIDFTGGDLLIGINKKVTPKKGKLIMFSGGPENLHLVDEVLKGKRISLLVWCSEKPGQFKRNKIFSNLPTYS